MASLSPHTGTLGRRLAGHLLRRASFNVSKARIDQFASMDATTAVNELFTIPPLTMPDGPISWVTGRAWMRDNSNPNFPKGTNGVAIEAVLSWLVHESLHDTSIRHKMVMFLHTMCYITQRGDNQDERAFWHFRLLQTYALGNLRALSPKMVKDHQMMYFLNNQTNSKSAPNEDFAREFLELFTILKGPQIGQGNYTNYTEGDIQAAARVLSGWRVSDRAQDPDTNLPTSTPVTYLHDTGEKTFSSAFGGRTIVGGSTEADIDRELEDFIQMLFDQIATARGYVRRMYRFFVSDRLSDEVEQDIIEPLAQDLFTNGYELEPVLRRLLTSQHFYDLDDSDSQDEIVGGKMRSPLDLALHTFNLFGLTNQIPSPERQGEIHYQDFYRRFLKDTFLQPAGMPTGFPPSVFGWPAFNQEPSYGKNWIDTNMALVRFAFAESILLGRRIVNGRKLDDILDGRTFKIEMAKYINQNISDPTDANLIVDELIALMFPETPDQVRRDDFLAIFLSDLSPINWRFEWINYRNTGDDSSIKVALQRLFEALLKAGEYQTM